MSESINRKTNSWLGVPTLVLLDILCIVSSLSLSLMISCRQEYLVCLISRNPYILPFIISITISAFYVFDLYFIAKDFRRFHQIINIFTALGITLPILLLINYFDKTTELGKRVLFIHTILMLLFTTIVRSLYSAFHKQYFLKNAIVVGEAHIIRLLPKLLRGENTDEWKHGIRLMGYVAEKNGDNHKSYKAMPCLGAMDAIGQIIASHSPELIIYATDIYGNANINELLIKEKMGGRYLVSAVGLYEAISGRVPYENISSSWLIEDCLRGNKFVAVKVKRLFDIVIGGILLLTSMPVIMLCGVIIKLESKGPALFKQKRIGKLGKPFTIYKLRTMRYSAAQSTSGQRGWGNLYKQNRNKITRFGGFLRRHHMDELPQFFNVVRGDMSIVGPRPEMEIFIKRCEKRIPFYRLRLSIKPGITGWAQVWYMHTSTLAGYKRKFEYDLYYLANVSLKFDIEIIARTALKLIGYPKP